MPDLRLQEGMMELMRNAKQRQPYPAEDVYFKTNPHVGGMAAEDDAIVMNPYAPLDPEQKRAVAMNEFIRLWMRKSKYQPQFQITPEQKQLFSNTPYGSDENALRQTIIGRILSNDPSAGAITPEQRTVADEVGHLMMQLR